MATYKLTHNKKGRERRVMLPFFLSRMKWSNQQHNRLRGHEHHGSTFLRPQGKHELHSTQLWRVCFLKNSSWTRKGLKAFLSLKCQNRNVGLMSSQHTDTAGLSEWPNEPPGWGRQTGGGSDPISHQWKLTSDAERTLVYQLHTPLTPFHSLLTSGLSLGWFFL